MYLGASVWIKKYSKIQQKEFIFFPPLNKKVDNATMMWLLRWTIVVILGKKKNGILHVSTKVSLHTTF